MGPNDLRNGRPERSVQSKGVEPLDSSCAVLSHPDEATGSVIPSLDPPGVTALREFFELLGRWEKELTDGPEGNVT